MLLRMIDDRPNLLSETAPQRDKTELISGRKSHSGIDTKTYCLNDCQSWRDFDFKDRPYLSRRNIQNSADVYFAPLGERIVFIVKGATQNQFISAVFVVKVTLRMEYQTNWTVKDNLCYWISNKPPTTTDF
jgi:hypothetical protein